MDSTAAQRRSEAINGHLIDAGESSSLLRINATAGEFVSGTDVYLELFYISVYMCIYIYYVF